MSADSAAIRRYAGWALVTGLSVAAAAAVLALLTGSFDDTDWRVILTSIGFAVASATSSILPPILRRMQPAAPPRSANGSLDRGTAFLVGAVIEIADRIELLNSDPGNREPEIRAQVTRLRDLAHSYET